jgi:hypothetical protein
MLPDVPQLSLILECIRKACQSKLQIPLVVAELETRISLPLTRETNTGPDLSHGSFVSIRFFFVTMMLICYALEDRSAWYVLAFAVACALGSAYGFLQGAWPFGLVEAVWAIIALRRWQSRSTNLQMKSFEDWLIYFMELAQLSASVRTRVALEFQTEIIYRAWPHHETHERQTHYA